MTVRSLVVAGLMTASLGAAVAQPSLATDLGRFTVPVPPIADNAGAVVLNVRLPSGLPEGVAVTVRSAQDGRVIGTIRPFGGPAEPGAEFRMVIPTWALTQGAGSEQRLEVQLQARGTTAVLRSEITRDTALPQLNLTPG